jgi:hypothetical protein
MIDSVYCCLLILNIRLSHYAQNVPRTCQLCLISNAGALNDESFKHLFLECNVTTAIQDWLIRKYIRNNVYDFQEKKVVFWMLSPWSGELQQFFGFICTCDTVPNLGNENSKMLFGPSVFGLWFQVPYSWLRAYKWIPGNRDGTIGNKLQWFIYLGKKRSYPTNRCTIKGWKTTKK